MSMVTALTPVTTRQPVKEELRSIINLTKVKLRIDKRSNFVFFIVAAVLLLGALVPTAVSLLQISEEIVVRDYSIADFSISFLVGAIIGFTINMFLYRQQNDRISVFPQTNTGRFAATQIINYSFLVIFALTVLIMYLICYAAVRLISIFVDNIYLALNFDIGFLLAGFVTFLLYLFLVVAVIELIGTILRKWTYYAAAVFVVLIALGVSYSAKVVEYAPKVFSFLVHEPSFGLFVLKALGLWIAIVALSFVINRFTVYHKSRDFSFKNRHMVIAAVVTAIAVIGIPALVIINFPSDRIYSEAYIERSPHDNLEDYLKDLPEIRIDVSHLPKGSDIYLHAGNVILPFTGTDDFNMFFSRGYQPFSAIIYDVSALNDIEGNTIVIKNSRPFFNYNGIDAVQFAKPEVSAYLDGYILHIKFTVQPAHIVFMPIWGIARQFEYFEDKGVLPEAAMGYSSGGNPQSEIWITVE